MINTSIGKYKITRLIGEGGMASVYEATHEMLGTKVAIKVLNPILSANEQIRERFKNEAKLMASLNHKNITKISDFDEQPNQLSIILEFLEGEDLDEKIKRQGALPDDEILSIFKQAFSAFQYAHEKGIVHRDIKPSNIYILPDGRVKILDFGIAKLFGEGNEMTKTGTQMGTPIYMSPEQVKSDKSIDHRSDIYSLGITLYAAIVGKPPYDATTESQFEIFNKIVFEPIRSLGIESKYNDIVAKACNKDREQRYQSCEEWLEALNNLGLASDDSTLKTAAPISEKTVIENINLAAPISDKTITDNKASDNEAPTSVSENNRVSPSSEKTDSTKKIVLAIVVGCLILTISLVFIKSNMHGASSEAYGDASGLATVDATIKATANTSEVETVASDNNIMDTTYNNQPVSIDSPSKKIPPNEKKNNKQIEAVKPLPILQDYHLYDTLFN
jgi:serine/threonine protein kinase